MKLPYFALLLFLGVQPLDAAAAPARSEVKASRYLFCASMNRFWVGVLEAKDPSNPSLPLRRDAGNAFWQAAILHSDAEFANKNLDRALEKVKVMAAGATRDNGKRLQQEDASCASALRDEVIPLFKSE